jgi:hypothetical protein
MTPDDPIHPQTGPQGAGEFEIVAAPVPMSFDAVHKILQKSDLKPFDKMRLVSLELRAMRQQRKEQIEGVLEIERAKIQTHVSVAKKVLIAHENTLVLKIRERFMQTANELGERVEMKQMEFLSDFAEKITKFQRELEGRDIADKFKQVILQQSDRAFERTLDKLCELAEELVTDATRKRG